MRLRVRLDKRAEGVVLPEFEPERVK